VKLNCYLIKGRFQYDAQLFNIFWHENLRSSKVIQLLYLIFIGEYVKNLVRGLYGNEKTNHDTYVNKQTHRKINLNVKILCKILNDFYSLVAPVEFECFRDVQDWLVIVSAYV
jgi:hypothetical protein